MACEDIEQRLSDLRSQKADVEEGLPLLQGKALELVLENLANIEAQIASEQINLANCVGASTPEVSLDTIGFVGTVEVETVGAARLWFGLTKSMDTADWIKIGPVRAWFTMNLEASDRPFFLAQLPLVMESMRSGLQVKVAHGGAASFHHWDPNDSFEVDGVRVVRTGMRM